MISPFISRLPEGYASVIRGDKAVDKHLEALSLQTAFSEPYEKPILKNSAA